MRQKADDRENCLVLTKTITIRFPLRELEQLAERAKREERSVSSVFRRAVRMYLKTEYKGD